ncbi:unnamed protein product [Rotaria magnacalcarata]|uniref:Uncharacterized protein n=3 Tax=Rotaria magnacalcarata TaxID=392030 RepID=A0A819LEQ7_9BILA|nr:unnamed protein product [Rotaria magnacalcarata]CAF3960129.1 unnamed protein product [Rotaria magnacalcarata]
MPFGLIIWFVAFAFTYGKHFNGGSITWAPVDPYDNGSSVDITITQSYSWTYPYVQCQDNVPMSTSTFSDANTNLSCVVDCSSDGGYSSAPIDILTNCTSASSSLSMMTSEATKTKTLSSGAHFYISYTGKAWIALNDPPEENLQWSLVTRIDLRTRPDGFINTSPVAKFVSPQYTFVNKTMKIDIPVSDANAGDDVRCRWATYTTGYRRRRRHSYEEENRINHEYTVHRYKIKNGNEEIMGSRKKRWNCGCEYNDPCSSASCTVAFCLGLKCTNTCCDIVVTTNTTTKATSSTTTTTDTTTTQETIGTLRSTSSFPIRQAIDECSDICYPGNLPNDTTLSNCTITFTGPKAGVWYAIAIQVEDFLDSTSMTPMSSVPVQILIYVQPEPKCSSAPLIFPLDRCLEVQIGISINFNLSMMNLCNETLSTLADIVVSSDITGMTRDNLTNSPNASISFVTFAWTPQTNQIGYQKLCIIAFTTENLQSDQYCVTFTVKNSSDLCVTTTTTTTTSATTITTATLTTTTAIQVPGPSINWILIVGVSSAVLSLAVGGSLCVLYRYLWIPVQQSRQQRTNIQIIGEQFFEQVPMNDALKIMMASRQRFKSDIPNREYLMNRLIQPYNNSNSIPLSDLHLSFTNSNFSEALTSMRDSEEHRTSSAIPTQKFRRINIEQLHKNENLNEITDNADCESVNDVDYDDNTQNVQHSKVTITRIPNWNESSQNSSITRQQDGSLSASSIKSSNSDQIKVTKISRYSSTLSQPIRTLSVEKISINSFDRTSMELEQPIRLRSNDSSLDANIEEQKSNGVTITKLPQKSNTFKSSPS